MLQIFVLQYYLIMTHIMAHNVLKNLPLQTIKQHVYFYELKISEGNFIKTELLNQEKTKKIFPAKIWT